MNDSGDIPPFEIKRPDGRALPKDHHLEYRPEKKDYRMKVAVNFDGGRFVGKRVVIPLHTKDPEVARLTRDGIIFLLSKLDVLSRPVQIVEADCVMGGDDFPPCE